MFDDSGNHSVYQRHVLVPCAPTLAAASETRVQITIHLYEFERKSNSLLFASACDGTLSAVRSRTTMSCHDLAALSNLLGLKISCQRLSLPHSAMSFQCTSAYIAEATARCASSRLRKELSAARKKYGLVRLASLEPALKLMAYKLFTQDLPRLSQEPPRTRKYVPALEFISEQRALWNTVHGFYCVH